MPTSSTVMVWPAEHYPHHRRLSHSIRLQRASPHVLNTLPIPTFSEWASDNYCTCNPSIFDLSWLARSLFFTTVDQGLLGARFEPALKCSLTLFFENLTKHRGHKNVEKPNKSSRSLPALQEVTSWTSLRASLSEVWQAFLTCFQAHDSHISETAVHSKFLNEE